MWRASESIFSDIIIKRVGSLTPPDINNSVERRRMLPVLKFLMEMDLVRNEINPAMVQRIPSYARRISNHIIGKRLPFMIHDSNTMSCGFSVLVLKFTSEMTIIGSIYIHNEQIITLGTVNAMIIAIRTASFSGLPPVGGQRFLADDTSNRYK